MLLTTIKTIKVGFINYLFAAGKPGKFYTVTKISKFWAQFGKITKPDQIGQIFLILQMVKALDGIQMLIYSKSLYFGQFWPYFSQF